MSKIDDLIKKYCPNGVDFKTVKEVLTLSRGIRVVRGQLSQEGEFAVYQNSMIPLGFYDKSNCPEKTTFIIAAGAAGEIGFSEKRFWAADDCYYIEQCKTFDSKYLYYVFLRNQHKLKSQVRKASVPRLSRIAIENLIIPVPPLEVQREIVQVLDSFTMLTAELSARKKQYEFYRDQLLSFKKVSPPLTLEWKTLGEICDMKAGKAISASDISSEQSKMFPYPCYGGNGIRGYVACNNQNGEYCLIGRQGALCGNVCFATGTFYATEHAVVVKNDARLNNRFLFHLLTAMNLNQYKSQGAQPGLAVGNLEKLSVPVPPIDIQKRIAKVLDNFEAICSDLKIGLPAEIELRKKQYEYYRDMLLSFEPLGAVLAKQAIISLYQYVYGYAEVPLNEFATIMRGGSFQKKDFAESGVPCIHYGQVYTRYGLYANQTFTYISEESAKNQKFAEPNDIVMAVTSENVEDICKCVAWIGNEKIAVSGHSAIIHHNQNAKYLSYYFHTSMFFGQKRKLAHGTKVMEVTPDKLGNITIPLPSLAEQERIVAILDRFDALVNDISTGIPAEIEARKKQYEYYRDKLLTFKNIS